MATVKKGQFVWYEHLTKDAPKAIGFYSDVVGWKTQPFQQGGDYVMWVSGQGPLGGVMKLPEEAEKMGAPPHWEAHIQVEDVDATTAQVKKLGGKVYKEPTDIPDVGRFAVLADPQGAVFNVFTPKEPMTPHDLSKAGEFCWNELLASDSEAAFRFYSQIFGWQILERMEMGPAGTYLVFGVGDQRLGGIMTAPKDKRMPPMWMFYTEIDDIDAAVKRAQNKGAKVLNGPMDVPGGRAAQLMDPQGAPFALHQAAVKH